MSDLQIGLILLGVALILAVLVFNWWQDRRIRRKMRNQFPEREHDPLMSTAQNPYSGRREPGLGAPESQDSDNADEDDPEDVDPTTEVVIDVTFAHPVSCDQLHSALQSLHKVGTKPVRLFAEREGGGHRARLRTDESYSSVQLAVLMANRSGPLTDIEWSKLWTLAQGLAERFDGTVEGPETEAVLQQAQALDVICANLDAQVGLVLDLRNSKNVDDVARILENAGFLRGDDHLAWMSDLGVPRFVALFDGVAAGQIQTEQVSRLDFLLDLPNSPTDEQAFSRMATVGRDLARRLDAVLLDDQGQALPDNTDDVIDKQLHAIFVRLEQAGYPAGQPRTGRIFS